MTLQAPWSGHEGKTLALEPDEVGLSVPPPPLSDSGSLHSSTNDAYSSSVVQQSTSKPRSFKQQTVNILHSGPGIRGASSSGPLMRAQSGCWLGLQLSKT